MQYSGIHSIFMMGSRQSGVIHQGGTTLLGRARKPSQKRHLGCILQVVWQAENGVNDIENRSLSTLTIITTIYASFGSLKMGKSQGLFLSSPLEWWEWQGWFPSLRNSLLRYSVLLFQPMLWLWQKFIQSLSSNVRRTFSNI